MNSLAFTRYASAIAVAKGSFDAAIAYAKSQGWPDEQRVVRVLKAASAAVASGSLPIAQNEQLDFAEYLRARTMIGGIQGLVRAPVGVRMVRTTSGARGSFVPEGEPTPVRQLSFSDPVFLNPAACRSSAVVTSELLRASSPSAQDVLAADLSAGLIAEADAKFVGFAAADSATPAGLLYGAPSIASSGSTVAQIDADLQLMINTALAGGVNLDAPAWLMSRRTRTFLANLRGSGGARSFPEIVANGTLLGWPLIDSAALELGGSPSTSIFALIDASQVAVSNDSIATIEHSSVATLQMSDSPSTGAQPLVSLWQNGLVGFRTAWYVTWARRHPAAAVYMLVSF